MRCVLALLLVCLCAVLLSSCSGGSAPTLFFRSEANLNEPVTMRVGDRVHLSLHENASTGFSWHIAWEPGGALTHVDEYTVPDLPVLDGSGATRHLIVEAAQSGSVLLTVQYGQWWDGGTKQEPQTLQITVLP